jgi:hypothetical protein
MPVFVDILEARKVPIQNYADYALSKLDLNSSS